MNVIFLGPPGAGKGTYASRICDTMKWAHISTGNILRDEVKDSTDLGKEAHEYMRRGDLVPDKLVISMLKNRIKHADCKKGFILDGFPRTIAQAEALEKVSNIDTVINLVIPDKIIVQKISARRVCENCGDIYNIADIQFGPNKEYRMPPQPPKKEGKCDKCGGKLAQRKDDMVNVIKDRLEVYHRQTEPLIDYYRNKNLLNEVEVTGSPEIMVPKIMDVMEID